MGFFDFIKKNPVVKELEKPQQTKEEIKSDPEDDFIAELRAKRLKENAPILTYEQIKNPPLMYTTKFQFDHVLTATTWGNHKAYLLNDNNASAFVRDMDYINEFVNIANQEIVGLPDMTVSRFDTAFEPIPDVSDQTWRYSKFLIEGLTATGKQKKYPVYIRWETISGQKHGMFYYDQYGLLSKGSVSVKNPDIESGIFNYSIDFINEKLSHIWAFTRDGKRALFNKNGL